MNSRQQHSREKGFSLIEALVAISILTVVGVGMLSILDQSQISYRTQNEAAETTQQLRLALNQIISYTRQAGNDPTESMVVEPLEIVGSGQIRLNSDVTGTIDSTTGNAMEATGDPDGALTSIYEQVTIRYDSASSSVLVNIGYGEQILCDRVSDLTFTFYDGAGSVTTTPANISRVRVSITGQTPDSGPTTADMIQSVTLVGETFMRSRATSIFG